MSHEGIANNPIGARLIAIGGKLRFEVEDYHTYYVSADADSDVFVLVHNTCADMARGREIHRKWDYVQNNITFLKEVFIPGAGRADAVDFINRIVYELMPDNPRAIRQGWRQLNRYISALEAEDSATWLKILITY